MSELRLDVGTANELKLALRVARGADGSEWTDQDVKTLISDTPLLGGLLDCVRGRAKVVVEEVKKTAEVVKNILKLLRIVTIKSTPAKRTDECFADETKYYRDPSVLWLLPETQEARGEETCEVGETTEKSRFVAMVQSLLGGIVETAVKKLSQLLIGSGRLLTLPQIEQLVERQEVGEDVGLLTNGWGNFFLVLNKEGSASVVVLYQNGGQWHVYACDLGYDNVWSAERRFFSRNKTL